MNTSQACLSPKLKCTASGENYKKAYAEVIIAEYAQRYGRLIDG